MPPAAADASALTVTRSFVLKHLTPDSAANLLNDLFPAPRPLNFTKVTDLRSIYMSGPEDAVQRAVQIEALIVSVNSSAYRRAVNWFQVLSFLA